MMWLNWVKKHLAWIISIAVILGLLIFLICFENIPRITYQYDEKTDSYIVHRVYGNAKSYIVLDTYKDKKVTKIGAKAFMDQSKLETVTLGSHIQEIERLSFSGCKNLQNIDLSNIKVIGRNAFADCESLTSVTIYAADVYGGAFYGCSTLKEVQLMDTKTIGSYAFAETAIQSITIPASCTELGIDAFYDCQALKAIIVYSSDLSNNDYLNQLSIVEFMS